MNDPRYFNPRKRAEKAEAHQRNAVCCYCGHITEIEQTQPESGYAAAIQHDQTCPQNPLIAKLVELEARLAVWESVVRMAQQVQDAQNWAVGMPDGDHYKRSGNRLADALALIPPEHRPEDAIPPADLPDPAPASGTED